MFIQVTDAKSGQVMSVNIREIKLVEPTIADPTQTHIVFGPDLGRVVKESYTAIRGLIGAIATLTSP